MRTLPFSTSASVVLDSTGSGTASVGPSSSNEVWTLATVAIHCDTAVNEAQAKVYAGSGPSPAYFQGTALWGSTGDSASATGVQLAVGQQVFAVWTGGDAGTTAHLTVQGTRTVA
jgi:hypothetical protein